MTNKDTFFVNVLKNNKALIALLTGLCSFFLLTYKLYNPVMPDSHSWLTVLGPLVSFIKKIPEPWWGVGGQANIPILSFLWYIVYLVTGTFKLDWIVYLNHLMLFFCVIGCWYILPGKLRRSKLTLFYAVLSWFNPVTISLTRGANSHTYPFFLFFILFVVIVFSWRRHCRPLLLFLPIAFVTVFSHRVMIFLVSWFFLGCVCFFPKEMKTSRSVILFSLFILLCCFAYLCNYCVMDFYDPELTLDFQGPFFNVERFFSFFMAPLTCLLLFLSFLRACVGKACLEEKISLFVISAVFVFAFVCVLLNKILIPVYLVELLPFAMLLSVFAFFYLARCFKVMVLVLQIIYVCFLVFVNTPYSEKINVSCLLGDSRLSNLVFGYGQSIYHTSFPYKIEHAYKKYLGIERLYDEIDELSSQSEVCVLLARQMCAMYIDCFQGIIFEKGLTRYRFGWDVPKDAKEVYIFFYVKREYGFFWNSDENHFSEEDSWMKYIDASDISLVLNMPCTDGGASVYALARIKERHLIPEFDYYLVCTRQNK